jgi:hypothetical protein
MTQLFKYQEKRSLMRVFKICAVLGVTLMAAPSFALVTTDVLPKGVRAGAFVWGRSAPVSASYDETGRMQSLVKPLNRSVTLDDLAAAEPDIKILENILNGMSAEQIGSNLFLANLYSNVRVSEERFVTGLLWGLTDKWSVGAIVPVVKRSTQVSFTSDIVNNAKAIQQKIGNIPGVSPGLQDFIDAGVDHNLFVQEVFLKNGYQAPQSSEFSALGDIELETRYRYFTSDKLNLALRGTVRLPTANHQPNLSNVFDRAAGEGVVAFKMGAIQSYSLIPYVLSFHGGAFGTYRLPGYKRVALPSDPEAPLANLNDPNQIENVRMKLGPSLNTDVGVMWDFWKGVVSLMGSYQYILRGADRYSGSQGLDYNRLSENTAGYEHGVEFSLELSSVPLFLADKALAPAKVAFSWYQPLAGKNMIYAPYGRLDVVMLF